jgi:hypothetical protein
MSDQLTWVGGQSFHYECTLPPSAPVNRPIRMTESPVQRGNRSGVPTTPKPEIIPRGQGRCAENTKSDEYEYFIVSHRKDCPF